MNPQMHVLYLARTGHVIAAFTRTAEPAQQETAADNFIGPDGLHLRGVGYDPNAHPAIVVTTFNSAEVVIASQDLTLLSTDLNPAVMRAPQSYTYDASQKLFTLLSGAVTLDVTHLPASVGITVPTVTAPLTTGVFIQGKSQATALASYSTITAAAVATTLALPTLSPGDYDTLLFVQGYPPSYRHFSSP